MNPAGQLPFFPPMPATDTHRRLVRIDALAAADGAGFFASPASILIEFVNPGPSGWHTRLLAAGPTTEIARHEAHTGGRVLAVSRPGSVLIPGLVNAHAHLDLTHLGPRTHDPSAGFVAWIDMIRAGRLAEDADIAKSVEHGLRLSLAAGTVAIGDIAGAPRGRPSLAPWRTMCKLGIRGVSYLEFFGIGQTVARSWALLPETLAAAAAEESAFAGRSARLGLSPHATTTVARKLYLDAVALARTGDVGGVGGDRSMCTHLAETPEEREFIAAGTGPHRELLERLGVWEPSIIEDLGRGLHPVAHLADILRSRPMTVAHVNDAPDEAIAILAATGTSVVYCPHASAYFGAERHFGPHRYRDMLAAGINVAIGTDSIVNLPPAAAGMPSATTPIDDASGISIWQELRFLYARDGTAPTTLLRMATVNGAHALQFDSAPFAFTRGAPLAGLLAVKVNETSPLDLPGRALAAALTSPHAPELLFTDNHSGLTGILAETARPSPTVTA